MMEEEQKTITGTDEAAVPEDSANTEEQIPAGAESADHPADTNAADHPAAVNTAENPVDTVPADSGIEPPQEGIYDQASLFDESDDRLMAAVEAILFTMGDSVEISALSKALNVRSSRLLHILDLLEKKYDAPSSGVMLQRFDNAVQMSTRPEQYENLIKIAKVPRKMQLSDSVIETLSIIAYRQPITKAEIESIRGVASDYALNRLLEYDLVKELGRKDAPGRPLLFGTTEQFLRSFGVKNLSELPELNTVKEEEFKEEAEQEVDARLGV